MTADGTLIERIDAALAGTRERFVDRNRHLASLLAESREEITRKDDALRRIVNLIPPTRIRLPEDIAELVRDLARRALAGTESPTQHGDEQ